MNVRELIKMLERCPQDMDVVLAYDSLVCKHVIQSDSCFIVQTAGPYEPRGVYLCAMDDAEDHRKEIGASKIPNA